MTEIIQAAFLGAIASALVTGTGTYIAFNGRLKRLEEENDDRKEKEAQEGDLTVERVSQRVTDISIELRSKSEKIDSELSRIKEKAESYKVQAGRLEEGIQNALQDYEKLYSVLNNFRDMDFNRAKELMEVISQNSDAIDFRTRLNDLERRLESQGRFNDYQNLIKAGRYDVHGDAAGSLRSHTSGDRYEEFYVSFDHHFDSPPLVFISLLMIDTSTEVYSRNVPWDKLNPMNSIQFLTSLDARFTRLKVEIKGNSVSNDGFKFIAHTWANSIVFGLNIAWIAFGK